MRTVATAQTAASGQRQPRRAPTPYRYARAIRSSRAALSALNPGERRVAIGLAGLPAAVLIDAIVNTPAFAPSVQQTFILGEMGVRAMLHPHRSIYADCVGVWHVGPRARDLSTPDWEAD